MGDGAYKRMDFWRKNPRYHKRQTCWTPPYTTAEPDVTRYRLQPRDKFMVMATDGLSELTRQEIVDHMGDLLKSGSERNPASYLI